ncbi:hypothetical protein PR202_ga20006 [Eleusine coracana subsp. coracana]|uniref:Uncharacterized protein n=1 Tax=Eleusine coracana subsp. coracana TaxID=191504 RepID=A0AAV5CXZ0_ELECO|nr:hypothetical protein PR202_ga20006 [Eleusine coracana subsp. coracana]
MIRVCSPCIGVGWCGAELRPPPRRPLFTGAGVVPLQPVAGRCIRAARMQLVTFVKPARRCEAAQWLRRMEPVAVECLPDRPSEEEFCAALRNGLILCNVLNRVNPGAVPKVVENPVVTVQTFDGPAQSAIQYFENMRNFLVAVSAMNLLTFETSDIEKGGSSMKVVDCILCLKGYHEWKLSEVEAQTNKCWNSFIFSPRSPLRNPELQKLNILFSSTFVLQVVRAFLLEWSESEDSPLDDMVIETILEQACKEFTILFASHRNQVRSLLRKMMKDDNGTLSKMDLVEAISKCLKENNGCSFSSLRLAHGGQGRLNDGGLLESQQEDLKKLKMSFNEMKLHVESTRADWESDLKRLESYFESQNHNAYHKLLEENRKLYNQVQDLKGNIRVYCRVKPFPKAQSDESVLTVHVQGKEIISGSTLRGCLHLVDLAGSERVDKSEATGERLTEAKHINKSLSALGDVIAALAQKSSHVPYRNSKLTQVLQDALGGQAKTLMFVHVNPETDAFNETMSTLKFAERVATIELGAARVNKEAGQVKDLKEEIAMLKVALADKEREAAQVKDLANRGASEMRNARTRSPLTANMSSKHEAGQESSVDTCTSEIRSASSGKQRRFRSPLSMRELEEKTPITSQELYLIARKFKTPSPPVRSSLSAERDILARSAENSGSIDCTPISKVEAPVKAPNSSSRNTPSSVLTAQNLRKFRDSEENRSKIPSVRQSMTKYKSDSTPKSQKEEQTSNRKSGAKVRSESKNTRDSSEIENELASDEPTFHFNRKVKKLPTQATRQSQNIDHRASVREMEPLTEGRQRRNWSKPPYAERTNIPLPDIRRSASLPRGKMALV